MLLKASDINNFYELHCDKSFAFDDVQEKCIRSLVGNCVYDVIRQNVIATKVIDTAPDHIKLLIDGGVYTRVNEFSCSCDCSCDCDKKHWIGLRKLVELCIKSKYLNTKRAEILRLTNKADGSVKLLQKSLQCDKIDLHNELVFHNNLGDCNCVSLCIFVDDHSDLIENFSGKTLSLISII